MQRLKIILFKFALFTLTTLIFLPLFSVSIYADFSIDGTINDASPWQERAIWWNRTWRYRIPIDVTPSVDTYDKIVISTIDWDATFAELDITSQQLDVNSLRLVSHTPAGHLEYRHTNNVNRFDTLPVRVSGVNNSMLEFMLIGKTDANETRRLFLYFDTDANPKPAKDYHYFSSSDQTDYISGTRTGPDLEGVTPPNYGVKLYKNSGGDFSLVKLGEHISDNTFYLYSPYYKVSGDNTNYRGAKAASYTTSLNPVYLTLNGVFTGYDPGSGPQTSGTGEFKVSQVLKDGKAYAVIQGSVQMTVNTNLTLNFINPVLTAMRSGTTQQAWYTDVNGNVIESSTGTTNVKWCECDDALIVKNTAAQTQAFQLDSFNYTSTSFNYRDIYTAWDATKQYLRYNTITGTWHAGDQISYAFTYIHAPNQKLTYAQIKPVIDSVDEVPAIEFGTSIEYSDEFFDAQLYYYEDKAWEYVIGDLAENGWGEDWNIVYQKDINTGEIQPAHHQDSSMGAGYILYAASLKASMTGEQRYYDIADKYANYFLELEQKDIEQYGPTSSGRISYFLNGSDDTTYFDTPPGMVKDDTSIDQVITSSMGLWTYYNLNHQKIEYAAQVKDLMVRMADYVVNSLDPEMTDEVKNVAIMLGERTGWVTNNRVHDADGDVYKKWYLQNTEQRLLTGSKGNVFFLYGYMDRLLATKDPVNLANRYIGVAADVGTAVQGYYHLQRGTGYPSSWGYMWDEFKMGQAFQSSNYNALKYNSGASPTHYLDLNSHGGARDSVDGRASTQEAAIMLWAALADPDGQIKVAGGLGEQYYEFAKSGIHSSIAFLMADNGAMREAYHGTLGVASAATSNIHTADFSGYFLMLLSYYHMFNSDVTNPSPQDKLDYVQGFSEDEGEVEVKLLGNTDIAQRFAFPSDEQAVVAGGVYENPTLTFNTSGKVVELIDRSYELQASLTFQTLVTGTIKQVGLTLAPESGDVSVQVTDWDDNYRRWVEDSIVQVNSVDHRVTGLLPNSYYLLKVDGEEYTLLLSDSEGEVEFAYEGGYSEHIFEIIQDISAPTGSVVISSGSEYTNQTAVGLTIVAQDDEDEVEDLEMMVSNNSDFSGADWQDFAPELSWDLLSSEGTKTVYLKLRDRAGNVSNTFNDTITLDLNPPVGSVIINDGATSTNSLKVKLSIHATDNVSGVTDMMISTDPSFHSASWEAYSVQKEIEFQGMDGIKTVYIKFKDAVSHISSVYFDDILYAQTPTTSEDSYSLTGSTAGDPGEFTEESQVDEPDPNAPVDKQEEDLEEESIYYRVKIVDRDGNPLVGAEVIILKLGIQVITDGEGYINLGQVAEGEYEVEVRYQGKSYRAVLGVGGEVDILELAINVRTEDKGWNWRVIVFWITAVGLSVGLLVFFYKVYKNSKISDFPRGSYQRV